MRFERRILLLSLMGGLAGSVTALALLWTGPWSGHARATLTVLIVLWWLGFGLAARSKVAFPLRTIANLIGAIHEGDFSLRVRGAGRDDAMAELIFEVNDLARALQDQRLGRMEATALLRKILGQIDVALFGFDADGRLRLVNDSGQALLGRPEQDLIGRTAGDLGLGACLTGPTPRIFDLSLPARTGRWEIRRTTYRDKGQSHCLVFLSDLTRTLHEEERQAWKRLIQILRHELNNSLAPIQSVAQTLLGLVGQTHSPDGKADDLREGLQIIAERADILGRFIASYSQLTRLPDPVLEDVAVETWVRHVVGIETRMAIDLRPGPVLTIQADRAQLDQLLINCLANAVEASLQTRPDGSGQVQVCWDVKDRSLRVWVDDDGPGLDPDRDPFVPFFSTKPEGSGIGLTLSRQIAEAHRGDLTLENHGQGPGCRALLRLPLS